MVLTRVTADEEDDPVLGQFLVLLATDISRSGTSLQVLDDCLLQGLQSLVGNVAVDLDAPLSADDE